MTASRRPLSVTLLAIATFAIGVSIIGGQLQTLLPLLQNEIALNGTNELVLDFDVISGIAALSLGFVPLTLSIGLWRLTTWGRALSICLFASLMIPSLLAALQLIADKTTSLRANLVLGGASAIALFILLHPHVAAAFTRQGDDS